VVNSSKSIIYNLSSHINVRTNSGKTKTPATAGLLLKVLWEV